MEGSTAPLIVGSPLLWAGAHEIKLIDHMGSRANLSKMINFLVVSPTLSLALLSSELLLDKKQQQEFRTELFFLSNPIRVQIISTSKQARSSTTSKIWGGISSPPLLSLFLITCCWKALPVCKRFGSPLPLPQSVYYIKACVHSNCRSARSEGGGGSGNKNKKIFPRKRSLFFLLDKIDGKVWAVAAAKWCILLQVGVFKLRLRVVMAMTQHFLMK